MRIEHYDADTHEVVPRRLFACVQGGAATGFQMIADALRERDSARAEVERLKWTQAYFLDEKSDRTWTLGELWAEVERLRQAVGLATTAVPSMVVDASDPVGMMQRVVAEVERLRLGRDRDIDALQAEVERLTNERNKALQAQLDLMRGTTQPAVYMTDIEAAARELEGMGFLSAGFARTMLAKHTRPLDREGLVRVIREAHASWTGAQERDPWRAASERSADAVLAYLGAQSGEQQGPRVVHREDEPWTEQDHKHGRFFVGNGVTGFQGPDHGTHFLATAPPKPPISPGHAGWLGESTPPPKPPEPNSIGAMFVPNCEREQPEPPEPAWTREQQDAAATITTVAARGGPRNAHRWDELCAALAKVAPLFAPKPPEPAKVRVKLPKTIYDKERRTLTVSATELRASLRSQGVEVDDE